MWSGSEGPGRWGWFLVLLALGGMGYLMVQDLYSLGETVVRAGGKKIPMTVENVLISRVISGDHWIIQAPLLEKVSGEVQGVSLDIRVSFSGKGGGAAFQAERGLFREDGGELRFWAIKGVASMDHREGFFEAPEALWVPARDEVSFPRGLQILLDGATLRGSEGVLRRDGALSLWGKVSGVWQERD